MKTERRRPSRGLDPLELRLYIVALLGAIYTISWRAIGGHVTALESTVATAPPPSQRAVWIEELPADMRPAIALPAGWQPATEARASPAMTPSRVVRVPTRRTTRVRTRSS